MKGILRELKYNRILSYISNKIDTANITTGNVFTYYSHGKLLLFKIHNDSYVIYVNRKSSNIILWKKLINFVNEAEIDECLNKLLRDKFNPTKIDILK